MKQTCSTYLLTKMEFTTWYMYPGNCNQATDSYKGKCCKSLLYHAFLMSIWHTSHCILQKYPVTLSQCAFYPWKMCRHRHRCRHE